MLTDNDVKQLGKWIGELSPDDHLIIVELLKNNSLSEAKKAKDALSCYDVGEMNIPELLYAYLRGHEEIDVLEHYKTSLDKMKKDCTTRIDVFKLEILHRTNVDNLNGMLQRHYDLFEHQRPEYARALNKLQKAVKLKMLRKKRQRQ